MPAFFFHINLLIFKQKIKEQFIKKDKSQINLFFIVMIIINIIDFNQTKGMKSNQNQVYTQNQKCQTPIQKVKTKKKSLINKKRIPIIVYPQFICKLSSNLFLPEGFQEHPQKLKYYQDLLIKVFNFKTMTSISKTDFYVCIQFKSIVNQIAKIQNEMEKYKFFSDRYFEDLVVLFNDLQKQKKSKNEEISAQQKSKQQELLETIIQMKDRKFLCYYYEMKKSIISVRKIYISRELLTLLGISIQEMQSDFIKYRHVFVQILTAQFCQHFISQTGKSLKIIFNKIKNQNLGLKQYLELSSGKFQDFIYRQKINNDGVKMQEKVSATISFFKLYPTSTFIQILDVNEQTIFESYQNRRQQMYQQFQAQVSKEETQSLNKIVKIQRVQNSTPDIVTNEQKYE